MSLRGKVVRLTDNAPEPGVRPYKYMAIKLEEPVCFRDSNDKEREVALKDVSKKWVGRHVVVTGTMEYGLAPSITVSKIVAKK